MRLSELGGKEIVDVGSGNKLGVMEECELAFDKKTGRVRCLMLEGGEGLWNFFRARRAAVIPWSAIRRVGDEVMIVDLSRAPDPGGE